MCIRQNKIGVYLSFLCEQLLLLPSPFLHQTLVNKLQQNKFMFSGWQVRYERAKKSDFTFTFLFVCLWVLILDFLAFLSLCKLACLMVRGLFL